MNEQIVAALGVALAAPIAPVALIDVPAALIAAEPNMQHMQPGVSHGSVWLDNCTDRQGIAYQNAAENRPRFATLAVLYSWVYAGDQQWIYDKATPNVVHSVDHGHFFPNGPDWTVGSLQGAGDPVIDASFQSCALDDSLLGPVLEQLRSLPRRTIAAAVAMPDHDWQITDDERIEMALYLRSRQQKLGGQ